MFTCLPRKLKPVGGVSVMGYSGINTAPPAVPVETVTEVSTGSELVAVVPVLTVPPPVRTARWDIARPRRKSSYPKRNYP